MLRSSTELTDRQREVLTFIRNGIEVNGYPPSVREMCAHFEVASPNGIVCHLIALEKKGHIIRGGGRSRAISLTESAQDRGIPFFPSLRALSDALQA